MYLQQKRAAEARFVSLAYKWLLINFILEICILVELKAFPIFRLFRIPKYLSTAYSLIGFSALLLSVCSACCHLLAIGRSVYKMKLSNPVKGSCQLLPSLSATNTSTDNLFGPTVFSRNENCNVKNACILGSSPSGNHSGFQVDGSLNLVNGGSPSIFSSGGPGIKRSFSTVREPVSLLNIALSPITGPPLSTNNCPSSDSSRSLLSSFNNVCHGNSLSPLQWNGLQSQSFQYQLSCTAAGPKRSGLTDQQRQKAFSLSPSSNHCQSDLAFTDALYSYQSNRDQIPELIADEYWEENNVPAHVLEQFTMDFRKWLQGTIFRRLVNEITAVNRHLNETSGEEAVIGSTSLDTLQQLCTTKYQYLPTLPVLLSFLEFMKDQGYLVSRLKELVRGSCLEEFRWDSGSRSISFPWKEHLPNDSLIVLHMFATYMDARMPPHPKCLTGRVFSQLYVVRHPDKPDFRSKFHTQIYQLNVQPPHFKLVLDGKLYSFPPGPNNLFHTILMCFHHAYKIDGKFRSINLGPSGLNMAWIFSKS